MNRLISMRIYILAKYIYKQGRNMSANRGYQYPYGCSPESQYGIVSDMYANVNVNYDIPKQSGYVSGFNGPSPLQPSRGYELQFNQKLDQLLELMKNHK